MVVYSYNGHSDVIAICNIDGDTLVTYEYDEFGNVTSETVIDEDFANFDNPYRYAGYEYIEEVKLYDLNARYYNPEIARFLSPDPYYNLGNRVIGLYEINIPNVWSIIQANGLYTYCGNSPIVLFDTDGLRSKKDADAIIKNNAEYIISAAKEFNIDPGVLAATIYAEQRLNVDWKDDYIDGICGFYGVDTSIGIGQVRISTAKFVEENGYMPKVIKEEWGWNIPLVGFVNGTEQMAREKELENPSKNIRYAAAYLRYFQDLWEEEYPEIGSSVEILATLYNLGHEQTSPNSEPKANDFGNFAKDNYNYVMTLLGLAEEEDD